jgi:antitoxin component of MazEF toxin-antitoxin module
MMKLQKRFNREVEGVEYSKWIVTIPPEEIEKLHWRAGQELDTVVKNNELVIKPHKEQ